MTELVQSIYIHIPFCLRKCFYCDFAIATISQQEIKERYVDTVCQEIALTAQRGANRATASSSTNVASLRTVFFGGGTPSLLNPQQLGRIIDAISIHFGITEDAEISLEANPGTVTTSSLQGYKAIGVNRISLGAQAFQTELLDYCGRGHNVQQIYDAVQSIDAAGIENFSLDLISGLPHQTLEHWQSSLAQSIELQPKHISIYDLTVEPDTAFYKRYQPGDRPLPTEEATVEMYLLASAELIAAGYEHYEISSYALSGYQCQHNRNYWLNQPFYGVGMGATSYLQQQRIDRPKKLRDYFDMVDIWQDRGIAPTAPKVSLTEELIDSLMQGLRLAEGLNLAKLQQKYGEASIEQVLDCLQPYFQKGWAKITDIPEPRLILVTPDGWLFSDQITTDLYESLTKQDASTPS